MSYQFNEQFNNQFSAYTQQFTAAAARVNRLALENAERAAAANQEVFGLNLKTSEALGQLTKNQFEAATEQAQATVAKATKAASKR